MSRPMTEAYQGSDTQGPLRGWSNRGKATGAALVMPPRAFWRAAASEAVREEQRDLAGRGLRPVAAVHEILGELDREVAADRSRRRLTGIGRAHERAHHLPRVGPLHDHRHERAAGDERDEVAE